MIRFFDDLEVQKGSINYAFGAQKNNIKELLSNFTILPSSPYVFTHSISYLFKTISLELLKLKPKWD